MTSRPGPGIGQVRRRPSQPVNNTSQYAQNCIDPSLSETERRPAEEILSKNRGPGNIKVKPAQLDKLHTATHDAVRLPPRGKPPLFFTNTTGNAFELPLQSPHSQASTTSTNLPVPPRPGSSLPGDISQQPRILPGGTGVKDVAIIKAPSPDAPPPSILFAGGKTADFFPWTGSHPEDTLSEALVKGGISNKPQIMNETNTARPSLWTNLKNKAGLSTLSTLFVAVLEKRQACGRLTAPNTFKPPPRLTLRDSTREAWLHDLANSTVGLRRLSRTIPHGITGKVLLDQCLNKNIPIPRATWLAKCVGINEMRSHKRKGQAGTITWVRGWTSSVEQFLDSTIGTIGQSDWKPRITYALQLVTHLYKDHLLEEEHFLDWVLKNLDSCPPERLFLWLLLVSIYWQDLTSSRRRSKRLAESLLNHAEKLYGLDEQSEPSPVLGFLEETIIRLLVTNPVSFLLPKTWDKHGGILHTLSQRRALPQINRVVEDLSTRNRRLLRPSKSPGASTVDSTSRLYRLLDSVDYSISVRIDRLAYDCMELISESSTLISSVLQWASSYYREGSHRVYLVTRLLRRWSHLGADIDDGVLSYLHSMMSNRSNDPCVVFRIIAELVRSKTFSTGRYLQWLIATGSVSQGTDLSAPSAWPVRLITEIPLSGLPEQVRVLRSTLLRGTIYSADEEAQALDHAKDMIRQQAPSLFGTEFTDRVSVVEKLTNLSSSIQLELSIWLRQQVASNAEFVEHVPTKDPNIKESGAVCRISAHDFHVVRSHIEAFSDLAILADVIGVVSTSLDCAVLTSAADTLHYHHQAFNAIGAFGPLFGKIAMRYAAIRTVRFPDCEMIISLTDLARIAHADPQLVQLLAYDMSHYEQKNSLAACSPASDNMADFGSDTAMTAEEEIDRILSSGTSMDRQIMSRVFIKIVQNLEEQIDKPSHQFKNHPIWLYRLRGFDETTFELILTEWLISLLLSHQVRLLAAVLPPLVSSGCMPLAKVSEIVKRCVSKWTASNPEEALRISIAGLDLLLPSEHLNCLCQPADAYRHRIEQHELCQNSEGRVLEAIHRMIELASTQPFSSVQTQFMGMLSSKRLLDVVRHFAVRDVQLLSTIMGIGKQSTTQTQRIHMKTLLDGLLDPTNHLHLNQRSLEQQVVLIVDSTNELSLAFCQLQIRHIFSTDVASADTSIESISSALLQAVKTAVEKDQSSWSNLIDGLEADLTSKIREHAEREIFNASIFLVTPAATGAEPPQKDENAFVQKYLTVIDFTSTGAPADGQSFAFGALIDRLKGIADALGKLSNHLNDTKDALPISRLRPWLDALLHLAVVHSSTLSEKAGNQQQAALLWSLRSILIHPALGITPSTAQYVFDVALFLSDSVSDEVRNHLAKLDAAKPVNNARCAFIFGTSPSTDGWLTLTKPVSPLTPTTSTSSPQPLSQQSGQSQTPHQYPQFQTSNPSPASLQRSLSQQHQQQLHGQIPGRVQPQYPQYPQHSKTLPQFQRMATISGQNPQQTQLQQMQQMQQMQSQMRASQPSPVQRPTPSQQLPAKVGPMKQEKPEMRQVPFSLRRWEILPESGGNPMGNETAISLSLFGARKV